MGTFSSWKDIVNGSNQLLTIQEVENEAPTNIVEPGNMLNGPSDTYSHLLEVEDLHGFQSG